MAWNKPGDSQNPWGRRPGQGGKSDNGFKDFQRKLESILKGRGGGGAGGAGGADGEAPNEWSLVLIVLGVLLAIWLGTGFFQVETAEQAVIQHFGKYSETRTQGLQWRWPWPIESSTIVNTKEVKSVAYKSRVLTADLNLVDMALGVQYQLRDPVKFLFQVRDPESTLREVSESAIREVVGRSNLEEIFVSKRQQMTARTLELIQRTLDQYNAGIYVTTVNLTDVQVPEAVLPSQRDANKALADRERLVKEAEAYSSGVIPVAEGSALRQLQEAEAYKAQVVAISEGEAARFSQLAIAYTHAPQVTRQRLYLETVESVVGKSRKIILDTKGSGNMIYLPLDKIIGNAAAAGDVATRAAAGTGTGNSNSTPAPASSSEPETVGSAPDARARGER